MKIEFDTRLTAKVLYGYLLHHTYRSLAGILGTIIGLALIAIYISNTAYGIIYLIVGLVIVLFLPIEMWLKARKQIKMNPGTKEPFHYVLTEEGISVMQGDQEAMAEWGNLYRAVNAGSTILVYTTPGNAYIFPKDDLGEKRAQVIQMISTHMEAGKVNIRP